MKTHDENAPATMEELNALFNSEEWKKTEALIDEAEKQMEALNLVPRNDGGERYIRDRYPITALYSRADLQEIARDECNAMLTEEEIQAASDAFFDDYPNEICLAVSEAVKFVISKRQLR